MYIYKIIQAALKNLNTSKVKFFVLTVFFVNLFWAFTIMSKSFYEINLDAIFNRGCYDSFFKTLLTNIVSFNWVYLVVWFINIVYSVIIICFGGFYNLYSNSFDSFSVMRIVPVYYNGSLSDVRTFWSVAGAQINSLNFDGFKKVFVFLCPITITNHIKSLFEGFNLYNSLGTIYTQDTTNLRFTSETFFLLLGFSMFIGSSILSFALMSYLGLYGVFIFNLITILFFWVATLCEVQEFIINNKVVSVVVGKWFTLWGHVTINFEIYIDSLSYSYLLLTLTIAVFVFIYTFSYFRYEPNVERLLLFINLFVISMILLVLAGNLFVLFLGWELIGLTSFFLINFWSTRVATLKSAFKAMTFNKLSDVSILIYLISTYLVTQEHNIQVILLQATRYQNFTIHFWNYEVSYIEFVCFFMLVAAFIKSAQIGTHIWLPDSMEAPVPASALIHSATLVSAGVFLILRFNAIFELSVYSKYIILYVGSFTAFFGGWCAIYQSDVKKILAYSTLSHCGFLIASCSVKVPEVTLFYLYVHGFFKACVFLCSGNVIRFSNNYQDVRRMGMYWKYLPFEVFITFVCLFNLAGAPFGLGFFIKHALISSFRHDSSSVVLVTFLLVTAAMSGIFYSAKILYYVFFDFKKAKKYTYSHYNNLDHKSNFFSTSTLAANISILGLFITGYIISIYINFNLMSCFSIAEYADLLSNESITFYNYSWPYKSFLNLSATINWFFIQLFLILCVSTWRNTFSSHNIIDTFLALISTIIIGYLLLLIVV